MAGMTTLENFRRDARLEAPVTRGLERRQNAGIVGLLLVVAPMFLLATAFMFYIALSGPAGGPADGDGSSASQTKDLLAGLFTLLMAFLMIGVAVSGLVKRHRVWKQRRATAELGARYGWHYQLEQPIGGFGGTLFRTGKEGILQDTLHIHEPRFAEVGNFSYTMGQRFEVGYVAIELPRSLPHMYLAAAKTQKKPRAYDIPFTPQQRLSLEGDFDRYFTLYCPREYERDALYIFTPDLMAMMIDRADGFDIEIVDRWLFVIAREPFDMTTEDVLRMTQELNHSIGDLTERQSSRYVDERATGSWSVGAAGKRLRDRRFFTQALIGSVIAWAAGVAGFFAYGHFTGAFDQLPW